MPLRTLEALQRIDKDRAKAIVACADAVAGGESDRNRIEIIEVFEGVGLIIVPPCPSLRTLERLRLVEIAPERFLLVAVGDYSVETLELDILDLMEYLPPDDEAERMALGELKQVLSRHRRRATITSGSIFLIGL